MGEILELFVLALSSLVWFAGATPDFVEKCCIFQGFGQKSGRIPHFTPSYKGASMVWCSNLNEH